MGRSRAKRSDDELDLEIQGHCTSARRALGRAVDVCARARRGQPRHEGRERYKQLMDLLTHCEQVRSVVPNQIKDPDLYPEELRGRVLDIEGYVRRANAAMRVADDMLRRAETAFNETGMTFAQEEADAIAATETQLRGLVASLESFRGLRRGRKEIEGKPIRRARQERKPMPTTLQPGLLPSPLE